VTNNTKKIASGPEISSQPLIKTPST